MQTRGSVMKKIILISLFGLVFSQTELTTRVFEFNNIEISNANQELDIRGALGGYGLSNIMISVYDFDSSESSDFSFRLMVSDEDATDEGSFLMIDWRENFLGLVKTKGKIIPFDLNSDDFIFIEQQSYWGSGSPPFYGNLKLAVTAEFPIEDTGYIEEGFDFCLVSGQNLVAFPCENPVSVETALPELAQAEIASIIGAGVATTNINGQFLGSLQNFSPGAGYWVKSNSSMCFNYTCTE